MPSNTALPGSGTLTVEIESILTSKAPPPVPNTYKPIAPMFE
jgi:hypothetical protein